MFTRIRHMLPHWHKHAHFLLKSKQLLPQPPVQVSHPPAHAVPTADDVGSLVDQMLVDGRFALLLRAQIARNLMPDFYEKAKQALSDSMGLVPAGTVYLEPCVFDVDYPLFATEDFNSPQEFTVAVQSVFLDRYLVTNQQYQQFVNAGGYQEMAIWDQEVWPAVLDFTDQTGEPGPRFWKDGRYLPGEERLPVVGVSWYEAVAYARWVGKRLPTDAEWVKAGSWPVTLSAGTSLQRQYPWGETFDRSKANVWGSEPGRMVAVDEFAEGVSVGGVYQLIGNAWEWTATTLETEPTTEEVLYGHGPLLKTIRGGAFDTYFEHQATCQFASGENPILRKHNIGFRCALSLCDIAGPPTDPPPGKPLDQLADSSAAIAGSSLPGESHAEQDELPCGEMAHQGPPFIEQAELFHDEAVEETLA
ncbi:MAG TPA: formylglycine-generating enzyme family protein [Pirellulales bacterium]|jgi:iron(II)-dependent oxidoreductase|nr:formylglycine-generating enzyme family protein [Pirellulales bacterium]